MTSSLVEAGMRWRFHHVCPPDWPLRLEQCGAGFFHSPPGLVAAGAEGEPFYGELMDGDDVLGITAGVHRRCRVPPRPRHAYVPTPPALAPGFETMGPRAVDALVLAGTDDGWTELAVDSFDAEGEVEPALNGTRLPARNEYAIPLAGTPDDLLKRLSTHHRRRLPDASDAWVLHTLAGGKARALMADVTQSAALRAGERRGATYEVHLPPAAAFREDPAWGLTTYAVMLDGQPLSAALVGWAGRRAYYVSGGSTPDGYARNASIWLHLQISLAFQSAGFTHYSLGGTPGTAVDPADPSYGLHRFKTGFGAEVRNCAGARWVFGAEHETGHRVTRWIREHLSRATEAAW
ncbi:MAG TPA: peptidoglycan bridge formation glycyltransferase FemA/FemB family protein [Gemmatimonadales bacterium]|nr:peptidoglycan bridge formation glycyltransferase FemA/FemB family protein [Gemmatimonadales bacterium]